MVSKVEKKSESASSDSKTLDGEDGDSLDEQPLDIGEHYLVRRGDDTWREYPTPRRRRAGAASAGGRAGAAGRRRRSSVRRRDAWPDAPCERGRRLASQRAVLRQLVSCRCDGTPFIRGDGIPRRTRRGRLADETHPRGNGLKAG